jgi:hypothetical protein
VTKWWTYVIVTLALVVAGMGEREMSSARGDRDSYAACHAPAPIHLSKRTSATSLDARAPSRSSSSAAIASQPFTLHGPALVLIGETAAHPGTDLGQASHRRHGARAPPQA